MEAISKELDDLFKDDVVKKPTARERAAGPEPEAIRLVQTIMRGQGIRAKQFIRPGVMLKK